MITVTSGANSDEFPFEGQTVAAVRAALKDIYGIADTAVATLDGQAASEDTVIPVDGDLVFSQRVAQKG